MICSVIVLVLCPQVGVEEYWHVYCGPPRDGSVSAMFWRSGVATCVDFDNAYGRRQNILQPRVRALMLHALDVLHLCRGLLGGPNCRSF